MRHGNTKIQCIQYARLHLFLGLVLAWSAQQSRALDLIGYLPYYRMSASYNSGTLPTQLGMLNEVRYFGLTAGSDGSIQPLSGSGTLQSHKDNIATIKQKIGTTSTRLDVTLGGAGESANFATIAASSTLRATFAQNVKNILDQTGATSVDIDWESPDNNNSAQLNNYAALLQQVKHTVGAADRVYATIEPQIKLPKTVFEGADAINGISLMTYDLSWWANDTADTNRGEHSLPQYVTDAVDAWTAPHGSTNRRPYVFGQWGLTTQDVTDEQNGTLNYGPEDLGVGLPFYGHAIGTSASPQGGAATTYSDLVAGDSTTDGNYFTYQGQTSWLPGPSLAEQRVQFAKDRGLQNLIIWELGQDLPPNNPYSLLYRAYLKNLGLTPLAGDFDADRDVDAADYAIWRTMFGQTGYGRAADSNGNQLVDAGDYVSWRKTITGPGSGAVANVTVPEPQCIWLLVLFARFVFPNFAFRRRKP
jgi:GH18 family chitinase